MLLLFCIPPVAGHTADSAVINGRYSVQWNNIPIASITILVLEDTDSYSIYAKLRSSGMVRWVKKFRREVWAEGIKADNNYRASHYKYTADYGHKKRTVQMRFNNGNVSHITITPPDNPDSREILTAADGMHTYDPLTMLHLVRQWAHTLLTAADEKAASALTFNMIDGRRLMKMTLINKGEATITYQGKKTNTLHLVGSRKPIKGFSAKEMNKYNQGEPELHIYLSATAPHIPLLYRINTPFGWVKAAWSQMK